jgi:SAM-dependent methyltransferase
MKKQVDKSHYEFSRYVSKRRWMSMWYQVNEVLSLNPGSVLEIGPGLGMLKALLAVFNVRVETLDLDPDLNPDYVASADAMPFSDGTYDVVCAFQMLEHLPYDASLKVFEEMARVAKHDLIISLPDVRPAWPYSVHIPKKGDFKFYILRPWLGPKRHRFNGEHYWEINKKGYSLDKVVGDFEAAGCVQVVRSYRVKENPFHRFMIFQHCYG